MRFRVHNPAKASRYKGKNPRVRSRRIRELVYCRYRGVTAGYFYDTFAYEICFYGIYFYGIYIYGIYFYSALKFISINCTVVRNT
jgi:hypothetical protein